VSREHPVLKPRRILGWIDRNKDLKIGQNSLSKSAMSNFQLSDFQLKTFRFNLPQNARQVEKSVTGVSIQPSGTYVRSSSSSSPRSSPDPATNISHRVDSRYTEDISPRVSLSSQHHASKTMQVAGGAGYSVARVTETRKRMEIRGLN